MSKKFILHLGLQQFTNNAVCRNWMRNDAVVLYLILLSWLVSMAKLVRCHPYQLE